MYRKLLLKFLVSLGIAAFFLWLTITHMARGIEQESQADFWTSILQAIRGLSPGTLALYCLLFLTLHVLRIWRWQFLIKPLGERDGRKIFRICAVGFAAIVIMPLRLGEMVRPFMLARESRVPMIAALGTAVVERVLDGLLITGLMFLCLATYGGDRATGFVTTAAYISLAIFSGALLMLILAASRHHWTVGLLNKTVGRIAPRLTWKVLYLVDSFLDGVRALRKERALQRFLIVTALYWGINGLSIAVLARGFGFEATVWQGFTLLAILVIGIMIPAGPGFVGNFQFFLSQGLLLFFSAETVAQAGLAFGLTMNVVQFIIQVGFGVPFFFLSSLGVRKLVESGWVRKSHDAMAPGSPKTDV
ncbi:MAG: flippase-like domain-containing protein [Bradymonadales bacterium]|nr:flippase-like domain-containing protein [Bradymonadales bacterium]